MADARPPDDPSARLHELEAAYGLLRTEHDELLAEHRRVRDQLEWPGATSASGAWRALAGGIARLVSRRRPRPAERSGHDHGANPGDVPAPRPASSPRPPRGPVGPAARLLDATRAESVSALAAARALAAEGDRVTVVHPGELGLDDPGVEVLVADRVPAELAARFGPARTLRVMSGTSPPTLLARDAQPLRQVVDAPGQADGLPPGPVFVGGTGRSGTWVLARMLAQHPRFVTIRTELRFHATPPGFAGVLAGELTPDEYAALVDGRWFRPASGSGNAKGLQLLVGNRELRAVLRDFRARAADDVPGALGQLMLDVTGPFVRGRGAVRWAETTPDNAAAAAALTTVLPTAHVVNTVRDGRDVAASVATMPWGPTTHVEGLEWWADRLRAAHRAMVAADPARVTTVRLEELLRLDREPTLSMLLDRLCFTDDAGVRAYFDRRMSAEHGHVGRWRRELDADQRDAFDGHYRDLLARLADEGVTGLPTDPDAVDQLARV